MTGNGGSGVGGLADLPWIEANCSTASDALGIETAELCVSLDRDSQTVVGLHPKVDVGFDFVPGDRRAQRNGPGYFYLGDLTLRYRSDGGEYRNVTTAMNRNAVTAGAAAGDVLAEADLAAALPGVPLSVRRSFVNVNGRLAMRFELTNQGSSTVEVGALGLPMAFNNIITNRSLEEAHARCSFVDPYIGGDAGYAQVTRLDGSGPALLVLPEAGTPFEAYNPIVNAPTEDSQDPVALFQELSPRGTTFEGFLEWMVHSRAYADNEWAGANPWNPPTSASLAPGESRTYGVRFVLADQIRTIEDTLVENHRPVAVGLPGYILPQDITGKLWVKAPSAIANLAVEPAGSLTLTPSGTAPGGFTSYAVSGSGWGRSQVTLTYEDGQTQSIQYYLTKPASEVVGDLGQFLTTNAWFVDPADPFGRSPSVMTYDRELNQIVTQTKQAWVAGLGDDGGATWLAGIMKQLGQPTAEQVAKYEEFIDGPLFGNLQYSEGELKWGVKRTLFYYEPGELGADYYDPSIDWSYWGAWTKAHTLQTPRSYNYPHVAALYWTMYRLARNTTGLVSTHTWDWYLNQAYQTVVAMTTIGADYAHVGLMDGTVFIEILKDLEREGMSGEASDLETRMRARADRWASEAYPFGSEMAWDSTGQEEVYGWTRHFGMHEKSAVCVDAILAYMPTVPHWGYNGCARRYWDFVYGGAKIGRIERMLHHYGSSLNAIPILTEYRDSPEDFHLLRIGYAGMMGSLSNIDQAGFPSMAFHSFPDTMRWDPITGDYGLNFFGHAYNTGAYLVEHPEFGWLGFGGNVTEQAGQIHLSVLDSFRQRLYLAPVGVYLTLEAGTFSEVSYSPTTHAITLVLSPSTPHTENARLRIEQPANPAGVGPFTPTTSFTVERGAQVIPLGTEPTTVTLNP